MRRIRPPIFVTFIFLMLQGIVFAARTESQHQGMHIRQASKDVFPSVKDEAWQVVMSHESSPQCGSFLMQQIARMRSENLQAATNKVLQTMQSNKNIMQQQWPLPSRDLH